MAEWKRDKIQCKNRAVLSARAEEGIVSTNCEQHESRNRVIV